MFSPVLQALVMHPEFWEALAWSNAHASLSEQSLVCIPAPTLSVHMALAHLLTLFGFSFVIYKLQTVLTKVKYF